MKTSECSQGREFGASWQFQGKICLWIWSDSNNNSQDHCETLRGNSWFFFFLSSSPPSCQEKPLSDWNITGRRQATYPRVPQRRHGQGQQALAAVQGQERVLGVMGTSAPPEAAAARSGTRDALRLLFDLRTVSFPCPACPGQPGTTKDKVPLPPWGQNFLGEHREPHYSSLKITQQHSPSHGKGRREAEADRAVPTSPKALGGTYLCHQINGSTVDSEIWVPKFFIPQNNMNVESFALEDR